MFRLYINDRPFLFRLSSKRNSIKVNEKRSNGVDNTDATVFVLDIAVDIVVAIDVVVRRERWNQHRTPSQ